MNATGSSNADAARATEESRIETASFGAIIDIRMRVCPDLL
jgi:hypothetical protein